MAFGEPELLDWALPGTEPTKLLCTRIVKHIILIAS